MWTYWWSGFFDGSTIASLWPSYWPTLEQPYRYFTVWATIGNAECIIHHRTPTTQARGSEHTHKYPLCIGTEIHVNLIWSRTHEGCTDCDTSTVWVSAPPSVDGASVKSICFWPWLADWREPMEWDLIWCQTEHLDEAAYMDFARVCVCACIGPCTTAYGVYVHPGESLCKEEPGLSHRCWTEWKDWRVSRFCMVKKIC